MQKEKAINLGNLDRNCRGCDVEIDGHNALFHESLCDNCWNEYTEKVNNGEIE